MAELKTKQTARSVAAFLKSIQDDERRAECKALCALMKKVTRAEPKMWGTSIVGFGSYRYQYPSGREGEWFLTGFSPRKQALTVYVMSGFGKHPELMRKLGKFKTGKSCLYLKGLDDVDPAVLRKLLSESVRSLKANKLK